MHYVSGNNPYVIGSATLLAPASPYYPAGADCVLYLPLGDGSDGYGDPTFADHSIYGNNAINTGGSLVPLGVSLDGNNDFLNSGSDTELDVDGSKTYIVWLNPQMTSWNDAGVWFHIGKGNFLPFFHGTALGETPGKMAVFNNASFVTGTNVIALNTWKMFSYVYEGGTSKVTAYADLVKEIDAVSLVCGDVAGGDFNIGRRPDNNWYIKMICGEVYYFNVIKSLADITDIRNFTKSRYGL